MFNGCKIDSVSIYGPRCSTARRFSPLLLSPGRGDFGDLGAARRAAVQYVGVDDDRRDDTMLGGGLIRSTVATTVQL